VNVLVEIRGVTKTYRRGGERIEVLHGIDLDIPRGDFVALMGPSGSGKTSLLNLIGGLDTPTAGTIVVDAALMLDWGFERECDAVLAVVAPRESQLARLKASRGWDENEVRRRLARTRSNDDFAALADEVVVNDRGEADAVAAARAALARLRARREAAKGGAP